MKTAEHDHRFDNALAQRRFAEQGLFLIGPQGGDVTAVAQAFAPVPTHFLFADAQWIHDPGTPDFQARYNRRISSLHLPPFQPFFCPPLFAQDASWEDHFLRLTKSYAKVGECITIGSSVNGWEHEAILKFYGTRFYDSTYLFCLSDPRELLLRNRTSSLIPMCESFLMTMKLFTEMAGLFPHVRIVYTEAIQAETWDQLNDFLHIPENTSIHFTRPQSPEAAELPSIVERIEKIYQEFKVLFPNGRKWEEADKPGVGNVRYAFLNRFIRQLDETLPQYRALLPKPVG